MGFCHCLILHEKITPPTRAVSNCMYGKNHGEEKVKNHRSA
jgi:hypothetical protein